MNLYKALAADYSKIFPSSLEKVDFFNALLPPGSEQDILDIGCASGEFDFQFLEPLRNITAIDLDSHMIEEARSQMLPSQKDSLRFLEADMVKFLSESKAESYDALCCLGNTLVYLRSEIALMDFLTSAHRVLKDKGQFVIQILNYANPSIRPGFEFPAVESDRIIFKRSYRESENPSALSFNTEVIDKVTGQIHRETHNHYPFKSTGLAESAKGAGYTRTGIYGDYSGKEAENRDFFHIIVLNK